MWFPPLPFEAASHTVKKKKHTQTTFHHENNNGHATRTTRIIFSKHNFCTLINHFHFQKSTTCTVSSSFWFLIFCAWSSFNRAKPTYKNINRYINPSPSISSQKTTMMKIDAIVHFKQELQINFSFQINIKMVYYEIPLQTLLRGLSSSFRSPIGQQIVYLTKSNICDMNLLEHFRKVLFLLPASQLRRTILTKNSLHQRRRLINEFITYKMQPFPKRFATE